MHFTIFSFFAFYDEQGRIKLIVKLKQEYSSEKHVLQMKHFISVESKINRKKKTPSRTFKDKHFHNPFGTELFPPKVSNLNANRSSLAMDGRWILSWIYQTILIFENSFCLKSWKQTFFFFSLSLKFFLSVLTVYLKVKLLEVCKITLTR